MGWDMYVWCGVSGDAVGIEEIPDDELFQFFASDLTVPVFVDDLHVGCDVSGGGLETFVHGAVAIDQPFGHLDRFAHAVSVAVVGLDDLAE